MNIHKNARLTPLGRERIAMQVLGGETPEAAAIGPDHAPGLHGRPRSWSGL
ncbi:MAG: hypothetical protein Q8P46_04945 [Hyphomicrobiales bacterium]|nr:hypothetical protein [Hyphomicrobiales bacterium]